MVTGAMAKGTEERTVANRGRFDKLSVHISTGSFRQVCFDRLSTRKASSAGNEHYASRQDELACLCVLSHARRQAEERCNISGSEPLRHMGVFHALQSA